MLSFCLSMKIHTPPTPSQEGKELPSVDMNIPNKSSFTGCLFVLAFLFRLDDVLDGFADRQFVQDTEAWGNSLDQLVQKVAGSAVSAVKDGDVSEVDDVVGCVADITDIDIHQVKTELPEFRIDVLTHFGQELIAVGVQLRLLHLPQLSHRFLQTSFARLDRVPLLFSIRPAKHLTDTPISKASKKRKNSRTRRFIIFIWLHP